VAGTFRVPKCVADVIVTVMVRPALVRTVHVEPVTDTSVPVTRLALRRGDALALGSALEVAAGDDAGVPAPDVTDDVLLAATATPTPRPTATTAAAAAMNAAR
jgi:hypothetical protein